MKRLNIMFLLILAALILVSCGEVFELEELTASDPKTLLTAKFLFGGELGSELLSRELNYKLDGSLPSGFRENTDDATKSIGDLELHGEFKYVFDKSSTSSAVNPNSVTITLKFSDFYNNVNADKTEKKIVTEAFEELVAIKKANNISNSIDDFTIYYYYPGTDKVSYLSWGKAKVNLGIDKLLALSDALAIIMIENPYRKLNLEGTDSSTCFTEFEDEDGIPYAGTVTVDFEYEKSTITSKIAILSVFNSLKKLTVEANATYVSVAEALPAINADEAEVSKTLSDFSLVYDAEKGILVYNRVNRYSLSLLTLMQIIN